jgi:glycosyltransferase involved in cell wall biosynthesis
MGGVENLILEICKKLDKNKVSPLVIVFQKDGKLQNEFAKENIPVFIVEKGSGLAYIMPFKLANLFKKNKIDLVNTHNQGAWLYGGIAAKLAGIPLLQTEHTTYAYLPKKAQRWNLLEFGLSLLTQQINTVSKSVADYMIHKEHISKNKIKIIYNGIDPHRYEVKFDVVLKKEKLGIKESEIIIGNIASLSDKKDQSTLLKAFQLVTKQIPNIKLLIAGEGCLRNELINLSKDLGLENKVSFLGNRRDIPELLQTFDLFVLSSIMEGFPIVLLEAMAAGLPIIATDVDGNSESVIHGETGLIVKPRDINEMANAIIQLLTNKEKAQQMGEAGKKRVKEKFTFEKMMQEYERIYLDTVSVANKNG